jgi:hypothetical protein
MLTAILVFSVITALMGLADLVVDIKAARPTRRSDALNQAVDHAIAYAEQVGKGKSGPEKFAHAVGCARDELKANKVKHTEAELGRRIEIRLRGQK